MEDEIGITGLFQCRSECVNKIMWKILDEADSIREQNFDPARQFYATCCRIESGEQFILNQNIGSGEGMQKGRFSCICIPYD